VFVVFRTIAALFTVVPCRIARTDSVQTDSGLTIFAVVVATATILALATSLAAAGRSADPPSVGFD
jgi:hypothetical protein